MIGRDSDAWSISERGEGTFFRGRENMVDQFGGSVLALEDLRVQADLGAARADTVKDPRTTRARRGGGGGGGGIAPARRRPSSG